MPNRLAAVISDTLYLYPASAADAVAVAIDTCRINLGANRRTTLLADLAEIPGWREASEEEAAAFQGWPEEGDGFDIPYSA